MVWLIFLGWLYDSNFHWFIFFYASFLKFSLVISQNVKKLLLQIQNCLTNILGYTCSSPFHWLFYCISSCCKMGLLKFLPKGKEKDIKLKYNKIRQIFLGCIYAFLLFNKKHLKNLLSFFFKELRNALYEWTINEKRKCKTTQRIFDIMNVLKL